MTVPTSMPDPLTESEIQAIRERAEAATPGPWRPIRSDPAEGCDVWWLVAPHALGIHNGEREFGSVPGGSKHSEADARHIAGMDPPTTLRLLSELSATKARLAEVEREISGFETSVRLGGFHPDVQRWLFSQIAILRAALATPTQETMP